MRKVTHKYVTRAQLTPTVGAPMKIFSITSNNMNQPELAGGGHRPLGTDEMSAWFFNYYVDSAEIVVQFRSVATALDSFVPSVCMIQSTIDPAPNVSQGMLGAAEQARTKYDVLQASVQGNCITLTEHFNPRKLFGIKDVADNLQLRGSIQANEPPPLLAYFHVIAGPIDDSTLTGPVDCFITVYYHTVWNETNEIIQSALP